MDGTFFMVKWRLHDGAVEEWDELLSLFENRSYSQLFQWGEYKKEFNWHVLRLIANNSQDDCIGLAQCLFKVYPFGISIMWIPGGPVGDLSIIGNNFFKILHEFSGAKYLYCRISPMDSQDEIKKITGWKKVKQSVNSRKSMILRLDNYDLDAGNKLSKNWKRNLKRSNNYNLSSKNITNPDYKIIESIYRDMEKYKDIGMQYSTKELASILKKLSKYLVLYICKNSNGIPIAVRGCLIHKNKAWDFIAATNKEARKKYASYKLFWDILVSCSEMKIYSYDMGGIDKKNNKGVWNFKKGTGAKEITYVSEYENSNMPLLIPLINMYIRYI